MGRPPVRVDIVQGGGPCRVPLERPNLVHRRAGLRCGGSPEVLALQVGGKSGRVTDQLERLGKRLFVPESTERVMRKQWRVRMQSGS